ncbi:alpha-glucosidase [Carnobacterium iners]|uniref:Alpha-glucosidase n=1 Tax=Carnobacterium iners TaxID=1073423 RepID=A0A1X7NCP4_9LACT|nr:alpha-glucosidase [Carnobacterium iners]SEL11161.1 alpha-glucosidase [Carnobacterium iners]SMH35005.1 alpha-glucosidase [Carnobacterium iners]
MNEVKSKWWEEAIIYQVYPRSFKDTSGNGIGDLRGIIQKLDYIKQLEVNAIWLNPIVKSPQVDNGYDVSDYYMIDPLFGTMEDVDELIEEAHKRDLKIIFDFVLNHTSVDHHWFQEAIKGRDSPYRDFYIWYDALPNGDLPNNWASIFGGSVWEKEPLGDQFYFHLFKKEMPDLNWDNRHVGNAMQDIGKFWLDKGIDGFRLDAFIHLDKSDDFSSKRLIDNREIVSAQEINENLPNIKNYIQTLSSELRKVNPTVFILGEAASVDADLAVTYTDPKNDMCDAIISFMLFPEDHSVKDSRLPFNMQHAILDKNEFKKTMTEWQEKLAPFGGPTLYWNNHDMPRAVSRFGDESYYRDNSSKMLATLMYLQKGIPFIYYGEELGMSNLKHENAQEFETPGATAFYAKSKELGYTEEHILKELNSTARDVSRGVMQWDDSDYAGFSTHIPWSGVNKEKKYTVYEEEKDPNSILAYYRKVLKYKKMPIFTKGSFHMFEVKGSLYSYERVLDKQKAIIICNFSDTKEQLLQIGMTENKWHVLLQNEGNCINGNCITLGPYGAIVLLENKSGEIKKQN